MNLSKVKKILRFSFETEKGVSLYFAILIMAILLAAALGLSTISFLQVRMVKGMGHSVIAFYAADTGIERELYEENGTGTPPYIGNLGGGITYKVTILDHGEGECPLDARYCVESVGSFQGVRRAIRIRR